MAKRPTRRFNLQDEARRLFRAAEARSDFTGAAALLRLMRDLRATEPPARAEAPFDVRQLTEDEFRELGLLLEPLEQFKARIRERLELEPAPRPTLPAPTTSIAQPIADPDVEAIADDPPFVLDDDEIEIEPEDGHDES